MHQRATVDQLLQATDENLKHVKRNLTPEEQDMLRQIDNYTQQARSASTDGDLVRARNLALKAHLLSDALAQP